MTSHNSLKLNLGCGMNYIDGYVNVDKFGIPDIFHNLEDFPWPWRDNSVSEIIANHVMEHLGKSTEEYFRIIKEIYRICKNNAKIFIAVPHPRHDTFINDPTHIRIITPESLKLFSKKKNHEWIEKKYSNSLLALSLDVDFEIISVNFVPDAYWQQKIETKEVKKTELFQIMKQYNNVIIEIHLVLRVIK